MLAEAEHELDDVARESPAPRVVLALAIAGVVLTPILFGLDLVRQSQTIAMPDLNETMLSADSAGHFLQTVGTWTRLGAFHPGPMHFYWLAPFLRAGDGQPSGLFLGTLVLVAVCSALIMLVVARRTTPLTAAGIGCVLLLAFHQISFEGLSYPWNPTMVILPVALGLFCVAATLDSGSYSYAFAGAVCGTFAVQAHMGAMVIGVALIAGSIGGVIIRRRSLGAPSRPLIVTAIVVAILVPWIPPLIDQVNGYGNLWTVMRYAVTGHISPRFVLFRPGVSKDLHPTGVIAHVATMTSLLEQGSARWGGADYINGLKRDPNVWSTVVLAGLVGIAVYGADLRRRWPAGANGFRVWLCRVALAGFLIELAGAFRARHEFRYYILSSSTGVGIALWSGVLLTLAPHVARLVRWRPPVFAAAGAVVAVVVALVVVDLSPPERPMGNRLDFDNAVATEIQRRAPSGTFHVVAADGSTVPAQQRVVMDLRHHRRSVKVTGPFDFRFSDLQRREPSQPDWRISVVPIDDPVPTTCNRVGRMIGRVICLAPEADAVAGRRGSS